MAPRITKNPAAVALGRRGGSVTSDAKAAAVRANGAKGGRPKKDKPALAATRELARGIVRYASRPGRQWTIAELGIPATEYRLDRLEDGDLHPLTIAHVTRVLRGVLR